MQARGEQGLETSKGLSIPSLRRAESQRMPGEGWGGARRDGGETELLGAGRIESPQGGRRALSLEVFLLKET